ncbi:glycoside hydrolase family 15 protein [Anaerobium acetethylicum]|uniref:Glucoamylase (Glucan-1,4-alpha-glucosidase), GH15 family n=1 Tax=Anaerobium acetethylicum TaxID=1619234 RepID=A0A1D3TUC7_9FIRM|nr:hypothetical protein [Anaerobium acetethylicum]SCP97618.1 Glucoamylase (glucan-1,4-alpha-glucosidase), GH15 family [Anaerobium acetethylicum]
MKTKTYTGVGLIGNENVAAIYTVNNGIADINGTGIYHLFYKKYDHDLIQSAATMVRVEDTLYYGNRKWQEHTHPNHLVPVHTHVEKSFRYVDEFELIDHCLRKTDSVYAYGKNRITFETRIFNEGNHAKTVSCFAYVAVRNDRQIESSISGAKDIMIHTGNAYFALITEDSDEFYMIEDSPTDFSYQTFLDIMEKKEQRKAVRTSRRLGAAQGKEFVIPPGGSITYQWSLVFGDSEAELEREISGFHFEIQRTEAEQYWDEWIKKGESRVEHMQEKEDKFREAAHTNLTAIKAVCLNGFIPADLTGHYYSNRMPCYYARDSIMVARAFLMAGHYEECEEIVQYLIKRERKGNGEFYQRYDGLGEPNEGANNNVFHQIDSVGYFGRIVCEFYRKTGRLLAEEGLLAELLGVIEQAEDRKGMAGPEGGVNEGVFGGAFITSSNMFIYGGILAMEELFGMLGNQECAARCQKVCRRIYEGIQTTFNQKLGRYDYGYVDYCDAVVRKYDTPQYFGPVYGYPNDAHMQDTHRYLLKNASFFEDGIGYSEQEYHHGPWLFNTLACAEYCKMYGEHDEYLKKMDWAEKHANAYGLLPEAVDANDENICFINPLTWACAEFVASYYR